MYLNVTIIKGGFDMATRKQVQARNKPKERGRTPRPAIGNYQSIIDTLQHSMDKNIAQIAKDLSDYYEHLEKFAKGQAKFSKDQIMAIRWHIERAEKFLDEHYEAEEEQGYGENERAETAATQSKANGTTGLICLDFNSDK